MVLMSIIPCQQYEEILIPEANTTPAREMYICTYLPYITKPYKIAVLYQTSPLPLYSSKSNISKINANEVMEMKNLQNQYTLFHHNLPRYLSNHA